jgi:opine dehydrogenase
MLSFTVLGSGNGGRALCAFIAGKGYPVIMYEPLEETEDYLRIKAEREMFLEGDISIGGRIKDATMDIREAVKDSDVIFIIVPSFAHRPIFGKLIPHLKDRQHVVLFPGNYGGFLFKKMMGDMEVTKDISISETSSLPFACRISSYNSVMIYKKKFKMKMATSPYGRNKEILEIVNDVFQNFTQFIPGENLLEIDLDNINQPLHPLPILLNYGTIEKSPETFRHYIDGVTPLISEIMMKMDEERLALGKKLSLNLIPTLEQLKMYYGENDSRTYFEYVNSPESPYKDLVGDHVKSRYLTEDVPYLLVPFTHLARHMDIQVPISETCIKLSSLLHDTDYFAVGTTLEKIGIADKSLVEIIKLAS